MSDESRPAPRPSSPASSPERGAGPSGYASAGTPPEPATGTPVEPATRASGEPSAGAARTAAVIPAAGRGVRLGPGAPKALRTLNGTPMLIHAVRAMAASRHVSLVVVVAPPGGAGEVRSLLDAYALPERTDFTVVPGGETRQESVRLGLDALPDGYDIVLVHDAARPLVPVDTVDAVIEAVRDGAPAVVPALPLADTVKQVEPAAVAGDPEPVVATPERALLRAVQTPQGFDRETLVHAHRTVTGEVTDDASMVEQLGRQVVVVPGHPEAFKVTRPLDLILAEAVLARRRRTDGF